MIFIADNLMCCGFATLVLDNCCANQSCIIQYTRTCTGTFNKAGDTPLSLAYKKRHLKTIKYLAQEHQCDPKCVYCVNC